MSAKVMTGTGEVWLAEKFHHSPSKVAEIAADSLRCHNMAILVKIHDQWGCQFLGQFSPAKAPIDYGHFLKLIKDSGIQYKTRDEAGYTIFEKI